MYYNTSYTCKNGSEILVYADIDYTVCGNNQDVGLDDHAEVESVTWYYTNTDKPVNRCVQKMLDDKYEMAINRHVNNNFDE